MDVKIFLKTARFTKRLTVMQIANEMGISIAYYSALENGHRPLTRPLVEKLIEKLQLTEIQGNTLKSLVSLKEYKFTKEDFTKKQLDVLQALDIKLGTLTDKQCREIIKLIGGKK